MDDINPNLIEEVEEAENFEVQQKTPEEAIQNFYDEKKEMVKEKAEDLKSSFSDKASKAKESVSEHWYDAKESISDRSENAREKISEKAERAKDSISETTSSVGAKASSWFHGVAQSIGLEKVPVDSAGHVKEMEKDVKPAGSEFLAKPVTDTTTRLNEPIWPTKEESEYKNPSLIHSLFGHGPHHKQNDHSGTIHSLGPMVDTSADHTHVANTTVGNESGLIGSHPVETHTHKGFFSNMFGGSSRDEIVGKDIETSKLQKDAIKYDEFVKDSGKEREGRQENNDRNKLAPEQLVD